MLRFLLPLLLLSGSIFSQKLINLDFEDTAGPNPVHWEVFGEGGDYTTGHSPLAHSGDHSATIKHTDGEADFRAFSNRIAVRVRGKQLKLTGWLKTEGVTDGHAGLWLRIDPGLGFDNMNDRGVTGTTDWTRFEIEMDLDDEAAEFVVFGGLLVGKGQVWIDDLELTLDGKPFTEAPRRPRAAAKLDTAFAAGSGITFPALTPELTRDLATVGKVWGFLKYHHPAVARGEYNWDYELFRFLPGFLAAADRTAVLATWVNSYPQPAPCTNCVEPTPDPAVVADYRWLKEPLLDDALRQTLTKLRDERESITKHYYIGTQGFTGNPKFKNEAAYSDMPYPDAGFRYLAALRLWNAVHYFFPYREETDVDWNEVLLNALPDFLRAEDEYAYEMAAIRMIGEIKDSHANLWRGNEVVNERRGDNVPPFRAAFVEGELTVVDYFSPSVKSPGIAVGDVITYVNGRSVAEYVREEAPWYPASNASAQRRDMAMHMLRTTAKEMSLTVTGEGPSREVTIPVNARQATEGYYRWYRQPDKDTPSYRMLDNNIGYLTLANVTDKDYAAAKEAFRDARGLIIDIRNYPTAFGPFAFGGFLTQEGAEFVKFTSMDFANPGYMKMGEPLTIPADTETFRGKVVVLVNELSQSQAEYTTMAFQAGDDVTVIGSQTAGADGNISRLDLPGGMQTMISGLGVFYPDGTKTQRIGIVPDIEVKPTQAGVRAGRDELLERAVEEILRR